MHGNIFILKAMERQSHGYVLHHKDPSWKTNEPERYAQWNVEDLIMLSNEEHTRLHQTGRKGYTLSDETRKKMSLARQGDKNPIHTLTPEQMKARGEKISVKVKAWQENNPNAKDFYKIIAAKAYDIPEDRLKAMLDKRRQKMLGKVWINDGVTEKLISKDEEIPYKWRFGRLGKSNSRD